jgi:hypothetical protein|tara:strand:- start:105 stop:227 length:123 start_codon:yes stop_codon:yes gene_type:complete
MLKEDASQIALWVEIPKHVAGGHVQETRHLRQNLALSAFA